MKLARVLFRKPRRVGTMELADCTVTDHHVDKLELDEQTNSIVMDGICVPYDGETVIEIERRNLACEECGAEFGTPQALGGHMQKHKAKASGDS